MDQRFAEFERRAKSDPTNRDVWLTYLRLALQMAGVKMNEFELSNFFSKNKTAFIRALSLRNKSVLPPKDISPLFVLFNQIFNGKQSKNKLLLLEMISHCERCDATREKKDRISLDNLKRLDKMLAELFTRTKSRKIRIAISDLRRRLKRRIEWHERRKK